MCNNNAPRREPLNKAQLGAWIALGVVFAALSAAQWEANRLLAVALLGTTAVAAAACAGTIAFNRHPGLSRTGTGTAIRAGFYALVGFAIAAGIASTIL